ncbi:MAG: cation:proton antiporter, partial [Phycisphaerae bacterium]
MPAKGKYKPLALTALLILAVVAVLAIHTSFAQQNHMPTALDGDGEAAGPSFAEKTFVDRLYDAFHDVGNWLVVGLALLLGRVGGRLGGRVRAPMVVGYLLVGVLLGRSALNVIDESSAESLGLITDFGLGIVAFMIGSELSRRMLQRLGRKLFVIVLCESLAVFMLVAGLILGLSHWLLPAGLAGAGALVLGAMAPASAPAGTVAVIQEYKARGPMTSLLLGIVGLDDGFAIALYAFAAAAAKMFLTDTDLSVASTLQGPTLEILGGLGLGAVMGLFLKVVLDRRRDSDDLMVYSIGVVLLTTGLANALGLSLILANLALGMVLVNLSPRQAERSYGSLQNIIAPIYVLFFVVAGAHLDLWLLAGLTLLGPVYIVARTAGKIGGAYTGAVLTHMDTTTRRYLGLGILSQAGVTIGLALTVAREFAAPQYGAAGEQLARLTINTVAATTIIFEIIGPLTTKLALVRAGEVGRAKTGGDLVK